MYFQLCSLGRSPLTSALANPKMWMWCHVSVPQRQAKQR